MRILLVTSHALPHVGGVEILVDKEIRALTAAGHKVVHVTSDIGGEGSTPQYPPSVRIIRVPSLSFLEKRLGLYCPLFSPKLLWILWSEVAKCDVVHAHNFMALNSTLALWIARLQEKPAILTEHNAIAPRSTWWKSISSRIAAEILGRIATRSATRLVAYNSRIMKVLERFGGRNKKCMFLPYPIDTSLFSPPTASQRQTARERLGWEQNRIKVLMVGRLVPEKGVPLLLQATDPTYDLVFCGSGDKSILGPLPRPGIEYQPPRPQPELITLYHAADVLVLPSYVEGFPLVAREALSCGLPVVLGYDPGYEPYRGLSGLIFTTLEPAAIRQNILLAIGLKDSNPPRTVDALCPDPDEWVRRLYSGIAREKRRTQA